jgi:hypothetical protein
MTSKSLDMILAIGFMEDLFIKCYMSGYGGEAPCDWIGLPVDFRLTSTPFVRLVCTPVLWTIPAAIVASK